jgi:hypothetical protein
LLLALVATAGTGRAWNASGHLQIALVAYRQLDAARQQKFVRLLGQHPRYQEDFAAQRPQDLSGAEEPEWTFAHAATWPDIARGIRGPRGDYNRPTWHYVNLPVFLSPADRDALQPALPNWVLPEGALGKQDRDLNVVQAIELSLRTLRRPGASDAERALYLSWLLHLVADIHQPLHTVALFSRTRFPSGDKGGNDVLVEGKGSLHGAWDNLLGADDSLGFVRAKVARAQADSLLVASARAAASQLSPRAWVDEGLALAESVVYTAEIRRATEGVERESSSEKPKARISETTLAAWRANAQMRAMVAALRLAKLLESLP